MKQHIAFSLIALSLGTTLGYAQPGTFYRPPTTAREDALDPTPIDSASDPNIDMFINDWRNAKPRAMYGHLAFRDILTKLEGSDPIHPARKGAVLVGITAISYATLAPGATVSGRAQTGERQAFYTTGGTGEITVNSKSWDVGKGTGFTLTPDFDFKLTSKAKEPLTFYVRTEPLPENFRSTGNLVVVQRFEHDRSVSAHWAHINNGGPGGMSLINIAPHTIPQPHSHAVDECWIMVEGETALLLGKHLMKMTPGQAYKVPPTLMAAHSNLNMGEEPVQMIYLGPAARGGGQGGRGAQAASGASGGQGGRGGGRGAQTTPAGLAARVGPEVSADYGMPISDFARLDSRMYIRAQEPDIDMFMGNWRDAFPKIMDGNLYFRDILTALEGPDSLHPTRKGAVLTNAEAVSYVMLESGSTAHKVEGELKRIQQTFVVNSGTGSITSGGKTVQLAKGMAFIIAPGLDFRLTAAGERYMTFYVVSEKLPEGFTPSAALTVVDNRAASPVANSWVLKERPLIAKADGLSQYKALTLSEMGSAMAMSRPYSADKDVEEIWIATDGNIDMLFGKQLRKLPAGTAYRVPSTGITAQAKINVSGKPADFIYMVK